MLPLNEGVSPGGLLGNPGWFFETRRCGMKMLAHECMFMEIVMGVSLGVVMGSYPRERRGEKLVPTPVHSDGIEP